MKETVMSIATAGALGLSALTFATADANVSFDPKYFPVVNDQVSLDTTLLDVKYFKKGELTTSDVQGLPETISYSNALLSNLTESTDRAVATLALKQVQGNLNQSSTTAPDYVRGGNRVFDLEAEVTALEARVVVLEKK